MKIIILLLFFIGSYFGAKGVKDCAKAEVVECSLTNALVMIFFIAGIIYLGLN